MSKIIKLTPDHIRECVDEFEKDLMSSKWADGKISFNKTIGAVSKKAKVFFTEQAWMKMQALIKEFNKEVAWHGVAFRGEDPEKDEYIIKDILVYPQTVSGVAVDMNTEEYAKWIEENIEDERFFNIRMQGHSHVNMGVRPSPTDIEHQKIILDQLADNMFYIFMIWNKQGNSDVRIYDLEKNILFETADIEIETLNDGYDMNAFIKSAKEIVKDTVHHYSTTGSNLTNDKSKKEKSEKKNAPTEKQDIPKPGKRKGKKKKHKNYSFSNTYKESDKQVSLFEEYDDPYRYYRY